MGSGAAETVSLVDAAGDECTELGPVKLASPASSDLDEATELELDSAEDSCRSFEGGDASVGDSAGEAETLVLKALGFRGRGAENRGPCCGRESVLVLLVRR